MITVQRCLLLFAQLPLPVGCSSPSPTPWSPRCSASGSCSFLVLLIHTIPLFFYFSCTPLIILSPPGPPNPSSPLVPLILLVPLVPLILLVPLVPLILLPPPGPLILLVPLVPLILLVPLVAKINIREFGVLVVLLHGCSRHLRKFYL